MIHLIRKIEFEASHYYRLPELTAEENQRRFGLNAHRHGHNYVLQVSVRGDITPKDGMVINIKDLDRVLREHVHDRYDHKLINEQLPDFQMKLATAENLTVAIWEEIAPHLTDCELHEVRLHESPALYAEYRGEDYMVTLTRVYEFSASHRLYSPALSAAENQEAYGKCSNPYGHGHNYVLEVSVRGTIDPRLGMVMDPDEVDRITRSKVIDKLDYKHLNADVEPFDRFSPTSENMVVWIWQQLAPPLEGLYRLRLHETSKSYFDYYGENNGYQVR